MKKYIKYIAVAALFILLCISVSITRRNSETLYDYALREPETAYAEHVTGTAASPCHNRHGKHPYDKDNRGSNRRGGN